MHTVEAPYEYTWRSAAVHYVEAYPGAGWKVTGEHYMLQNNQFIVLGYENVVDCSIYDGWWDFDNQ